jgi:predicted RND superfamily exporter protein
MRPLHEHLAGRLLHKLAAGLEAHPGWFVFPQLVLLAAAIAYTATDLRFSTNRSDLVSAHEKYQQNFLVLKQEFKFQDSLVAIVESEGQHKNRQFVERLALKLQSEPDLFVTFISKAISS